MTPRVVLAVVGALVVSAHCSPTKIGVATSHYNPNSIAQNERVLNLFLRLAEHTANRLVRLRSLATAPWSGPDVYERDIDVDGPSEEAGSAGTGDFLLRREDGVILVHERAPDGLDIFGRRSNANFRGFRRNHDSPIRAVVVPGNWRTSPAEDEIRSEIGTGSEGVSSTDLDVERRDDASGVLRSRSSKMTPVAELEKSEDDAWPRQFTVEEGDDVDRSRQLWKGKSWGPHNRGIGLEDNPAGSRRKIDGSINEGILSPRFQVEEQSNVDNSEELWDDDESSAEARKNFEDSREEPEYLSSISEERNTDEAETTREGRNHFERNENARSTSPEKKRTEEIVGEDVAPKNRAFFGLEKNFDIGLTHSLAHQSESSGGDAGSLGYFGKIGGSIGASLQGKLLAGAASSFGAAHDVSSHGQAASSAVTGQAEKHLGIGLGIGLQGTGSSQHVETAGITSKSPQILQHQVNAVSSEKSGSISGSIGANLQGSFQGNAAAFSGVAHNTLSQGQVATDAVSKTAAGQFGIGLAAGLQGAASLDHLHTAGATNGISQAAGHQFNTVSLGHSGKIGGSVETAVQGNLQGNTVSSVGVANEVLTQGRGKTDAVSKTTAGQVGIGLVAGLQGAASLEHLHTAGATNSISQAAGHQFNTVSLGHSGKIGGSVETAVQGNLQGNTVSSVGVANEVRTQGRGNTGAVAKTAAGQFGIGLAAGLQGAASLNHLHTSTATSKIPQAVGQQFNTVSVGHSGGINGSLKTALQETFQGNTASSVGATDKVLSRGRVTTAEISGKTEKHFGAGLAVGLHGSSSAEYQKTSSGIIEIPQEVSHQAQASSLQNVQTSSSSFGANLGGHFHANAASSGGVVHSIATQGGSASNAISKKAENHSGVGLAIGLQGAASAEHFKETASAVNVPQDVGHEVQSSLKNVGSASGSAGASLGGHLQANAASSFGVIHGIASQGGSSTAISGNAEKHSGAGLSMGLLREGVSNAHSVLQSSGISGSIGGSLGFGLQANAAASAKLRKNTKATSRMYTDHFNSRRNEAANSKWDGGHIELASRNGEEEPWSRLESVNDPDDIFEEGRSNESQSRRQSSIQEDVAVPEYPQYNDYQDFSTRGQITNTLLHVPL